MKNNINFNSEICECCGQAKTYLLPIDSGVIMIVKALAIAIRTKGINIIHPTKEMEVPASKWNFERAMNEGVLTSNQIGNFTKARVHGLVAKFIDHPGNWLLTRKGAQFLRGERVPKFAIVQKGKIGSRSHKQDYFRPDKFTCTVDEILKDRKGLPVWQGIDFDIVEGRIVTDLEMLKNKKEKQGGLF